MFAGGWNNTSCCRDFICIYRKLIATAGVVPSPAAAVIPREVSEEISDEKLHGIEPKNFLDDITQLIQGKHHRWTILKCVQCKVVTVIPPEQVKNNYILLQLKNNVGLLYPNEIVKITE